MYSFEEVVKADPELAKAMELETGRQNDHIELIVFFLIVMEIPRSLNSIRFRKERRGIIAKKHCIFAPIGYNYSWYIPALE